MIGYGDVVGNGSRSFESIVLVTDVMMTSFEIGTSREVVSKYRSSNTLDTELHDVISFDFNEVVSSILDDVILDDEITILLVVVEGKILLTDEAMEGVGEIERESGDKLSVHGDEAANVKL